MSNNSNGAKCSDCGSKNWTITKQSTIKSYSSIDAQGNASKWVEISREDKKPTVECSKCGGTQAEGFEIEVLKKGKGWKVTFQTNWWKKHGYETDGKDVKGG
jgi:DNA-directed RNA polymerase subunit RPC12/RpoP